MKTGAVLPVGALVLLVLLAIGGPVIFHDRALQPDVSRRLQPPLSAYLLGSDHLGRDVLGRALFGLRYAFISTFAAATIAILGGAIVGGMSAQFGGWFEIVSMRIVDALLSIPALLLALSFTTIFGSGLLQLGISVGLSLAPAYSRMARAAVISVKSAPFVEASAALGAGKRRILVRHLIPNALPQLAASGSVIFGWALVSAVALDFLGVGGSPSSPTLGNMLNDGRANLFAAPWIICTPSILIVISVFVIARLGKAIVASGA